VPHLELEENDLLSEYSGDLADELDKRENLTELTNVLVEIGTRQGCALTGSG
jgi:hypothetical protein